MSRPPSPKAEEIFLAAGELAVADRDAFLVSACAGDDGLRAEVTGLFRAAGSADDYFSQLPRRLGIERLRDDGEQTRYQAHQGQQFGKYRLTTRLGAGGTGEVWRAERSDGRFEGEVAIKLLTRLGSKSALKQFDGEANYLAKLSHSHIARLIDAGVGPDEVPFLILDYVDGHPIDQYCAANALRIDERIKLFVDVLEAVGHAHTCLIVHSDIKPTNVMVTADGDVKLLDFGIATLLSTVESGTHVVGLTPGFAAPEQLAGGNITTATDIYSLGLLLYVLLAGCNPRKREGLDSLVRLQNVAMQAPPSLTDTALLDAQSTGGELERRAAERRISTTAFVRTLRGELDHIVRKALAVNAEDRYRSASDFAADLERYLRNQPVVAYPDSVRYRAGKFVRRHRGSVLSATLTALLLVAAAVLTTWQGLEARRQRDAAIYQQQRVHASNELYSLLLEEMGSGGQPFTAIELLDRGAELLERQFDANDPFVGRVYFDLSRRYSNLREQNRELELLALAEAAARSGGDDDLLAAALCATAIRTVLPDLDRAREIVAESAVALGRVPEPSLDTLVVCTRVQARLLQIDGDYDAAIALLQSAVQRLENATVVSTHLRGITMNDLSSLYFRDARYAESLSVLEGILDMLERTGRGNTLGYSQVASNRAVNLGSIGEVRTEAEIRRQLIERVERSNWADERGLLPFRLSYAATLIRLSRFHEGIALAEDSLNVAQSLGNDLNVAMAHLILASGYAATERPDEAESNVDAAEAALAGNPGAWRFQLTRAKLLRAKIARQRGEIEDADAVIDELLREQGYPSLDNASPRLRAALSAAASAALDAQDWATAEQMATDLVTLGERVGRGPNTNADVGHALVQRARARTAIGSMEQARADLQRAVRILATGLGEDNAETTEARELLANLDR